MVAKDYIGRTSIVDARDNLTTIMLVSCFFNTL